MHIAAHRNWCLHLCMWVYACMRACVCTLTHCVHTMCVCTFLYVSLHFPSYWDRVSLCCASCRLTHKHWGILLTFFYLTESTGACLPWCMALHKFWRGDDDRQVLVLMQQDFFANLTNLTVHQTLYLVNVKFLIILFKFLLEKNWRLINIIVFFFKKSKIQIKSHKTLGILLFGGAFMNMLLPVTCGIISEQAFTTEY